MHPELERLVPGWRETFDMEAFVARLLSDAETVESAFADTFEEQFLSGAPVDDEMAQRHEDVSYFLGEDLWEYDGLGSFLEQNFPGTRWFLGFSHSIDWVSDIALGYERFGVLPLSVGALIFRRSDDGRTCRFIHERWPEPLSANQAIRRFLVQELRSYREGDRYQRRFEILEEGDVIFEVLTEVVGNQPVDWVAAIRTELDRESWKAAGPEALRQVAELVAADSDDERDATVQLAESIRATGGPVPGMGTVNFARLRNLFWGLLRDSRTSVPYNLPLRRAIDELLFPWWTEDGVFTRKLQEALLNSDSLTTAFVTTFRAHFSDMLERPGQRARWARIEQYLSAHWLSRAVEAFLCGDWPGTRGTFEDEDQNGYFPGAGEFLSVSRGGERIAYGLIAFDDSGVIYTRPDVPATSVIEADIVARWQPPQTQDEAVSSFIESRVTDIVRGTRTDEHFRVQVDWLPLRDAMKRILGEDPSAWLGALRMSESRDPVGAEFRDGFLYPGALRTEAPESLRDFADALLDGTVSPAQGSSDYERMVDVVCLRYFWPARRSLGGDGSAGAYVGR